MDPATMQLVQIYDGAIFPDTFGWTNAYFAGMSFPNFYPPLFHWLVALIHHTHLVSFATSFKLVMALPILLIPAAFWFFRLGPRRKGFPEAFSVAIASMVLLTLGEVFQPNTGLDMSSTILDGFYTQPLGFLSAASLVARLPDPETEMVAFHVLRITFGVNGTGKLLQRHHCAGRSSLQCSCLTPSAGFVLTIEIVATYFKARAYHTFSLPLWRCS
jgi:hypothetical protein